MGVSWEGRTGPGPRRAPQMQSGRHTGPRASDGAPTTVYATMRDLAAQGALWEAAWARRCPPASLETLELDVRDSDSVAAARARVTEGRVDVLVCNAGRGLLGPLEAHGLGAVGSVLDVNVVGTVRTVQAFLPDMKRRGSGRVLVTGSVGGLMGLPFNAVYCASKFALEGLCESLAVLLLPFGIQSSWPRCARRSLLCATSAPSAFCPSCACASTTRAAAATWPPCIARCSPLTQEPRSLGPPSQALPRGKAVRTSDLSPHRPGSQAAARP
ncbi:estradiol 17-beta-dehydrogenase 1 isoform X3 [Octodon degus]|uniref:Estradiol 17-beta-dehydrogenase 1 isoform X3 n=1 Tax=Octodon degus TaxID=10160 RepID=A0A6P6ENL7_OCTDE|nr:estradiol 17-beta-dehydrogenase 1 isoform X3 [Octodon degus]